MPSHFSRALCSGPIPFCLGLFLMTMSCAEPQGIEDDPDSEGLQAPTRRVLSSSDPRGAWLGVWGSGPDEVLIAGGQPDAGALLRWDGTTLTSEALPADLPLLNWVHGAGRRTWVVGNEGVILMREAGGSWVQQPSPVDVDLWGIWAVDERDAWAVGGDAFTEDPPVVLHWDGVRWSELPGPYEGTPPTVFPRAFFKVFGTDASNAWIVGASGALLQWDGSSLRWQPSGTSSDLVAGWALDETTALISGGRGNGELVFLEEGGWSATGVLAVGGLNASWADPVTRLAWSVGERGEVVRTDLQTRQRVRAPGHLLQLADLRGRSWRRRGAPLPGSRRLQLPAHRSADA